MTSSQNLPRIAGALFLALVVPPSLTYGLSSVIVPTGMDLFFTIVVEILAFVAAAAILRARPGRAVLAFLVYMPSMFVVIFWIGYRAGYYDLP